MKRIVVFNDKGGVGKSTITYQLAGAFAALGMKVLVLDMDRSRNQTHRWCQRSFTGKPTLYDVILERVRLDQVAVPSDDFPSVFVAPASPHLGESLSTKLQEDMDGHLRLRYAFEDLPSGLFDIALIDTRPDRMFASRNGVAAATDVIVPFEADEFSAEGIVSVHDMIARTQRFLPDVRLRGHVVNKFKVARGDERAFLHQLLELDIFQPLFDVELPDSAAIKRSTNQRRPLCLTRPRSPEAMLLASLRDQIIGTRPMRSVPNPSQAIKPV